MQVVAGYLLSAPPARSAGCPFTTLQEVWEAEHLASLSRKYGADECPEWRRGGLPVSSPSQASLLEALLSARVSLELELD
jgi:hypothetical protein